MNIRRMTEGDLPQVCIIETETFSQPWSENAFLSSLRNEAYVYLACLDADEKMVLGYCGYVRSFEIGDITNMAVRSDVRRRGIGKGLLAALMGHGRAEGIERFALEVRKSNLAAVKLYESLGFRIEGTRKNFYRLPTEDAWIMWTPPLSE